MFTARYERAIIMLHSKEGCPQRQASRPLDHDQLDVQQHCPAGILAAFAGAGFT
jgi:hypothetical protein